MLAAVNQDVSQGGWRWDKAVCRFCGTGCGIMVATKDDRIVAVKGDPAAPVNRGLNCIKGYFNAKIMYGEDRLKTPLLRVDEAGNFSGFDWDYCRAVAAAVLGDAEAVEGRPTTATCASSNVF